MGIQIDIPDEKLENMTDGARKELELQTRMYADNVIKEANLIEDGNREDGANKEITSSIVKQAVRKSRNSAKKKNGKKKVFVKVISTFSLLLTGWLFDINGYKDEFVKMLFFIVFLLVSCATTVINAIEEE